MGRSITFIEKLSTGYPFIDEEFELQFVSYKKLPLALKKIDSHQKYHVFVS